MDAMLSNATLFPRPTHLPVCTVTSTSNSAATSFAPISSKKFYFASRSQRRAPRSRRSSNSSTVGKFSITCGGITEINESQFSDTVLKSDRPVLVEFVANWCGPCRLISPAIEWVAQVWFLSYQSFFFFLIQLGFENLCICMLICSVSLYRLCMYVYDIRIQMCRRVVWMNKVYDQHRKKESTTKSTSKLKQTWQLKLCKEIHLKL